MEAVNIWVADKGHSILPVTAFPILAFSNLNISNLGFLLQFVHSPHSQTALLYTAISDSGKEPHVVMASRWTLVRKVFFQK